MAVQQSRLEHHDFQIDRLRCFDVPFHHVPLSVRRVLERHLEPEHVYGHCCWRDVAEKLGFDRDDIQFIASLRPTANRTATEIMLDKYSAFGRLCTVGKFCHALRDLAIYRAFDYMIQTDVQEEIYKKYEETSNNKNKTQYRSRIMITYGADSEPVVCRIASNLDKGFDCFLDSDSVGQDELDQRLKETDYLMVCMSPDYHMDMTTYFDENQTDADNQSLLHAKYIYNKASHLYEKDKVFILIVKPVECDFSSYQNIFTYDEAGWDRMINLLMSKDRKLQFQRTSIARRPITWIKKKSLFSRLCSK